MRYKKYFKRIIRLIFIITAVIISASCDLLFKEHFFLDNELMQDRSIIGTWIPCLDENSCKNLSDKEVLVITLQNNGLFNVVYNTNRNSRNKDDAIFFDGKTYTMQKKTFICLRVKGNSKTNKEDEYVMIYNYKITGDILSAYELSKDQFIQLKQRNIITGFNKGGEGFYTNKTFYVTSSVKQIRDAINKIGIDSIIRKKPILFKRM